MPAAVVSIVEQIETATGVNILDAVAAPRSVQLDAGGQPVENT
jgi:hypothetical protein